MMYDRRLVEQLKHARLPPKQIQKYEVEKTIIIIVLIIIFSLIIKVIT